MKDHDKTLLQDMQQIQIDIGVDKPIEPMRNYIRSKFLKDRIDELLPKENFFFHKIFKGNSEDAIRRNLIEKRELHRFIDMHMKYGRFFIK